MLTMIPFDTEDEAVEIANDTPYGLAAYVQTGDPERAERVTRADCGPGMVQVNGTSRAGQQPLRWLQAVGGRT